MPMKPREMEKILADGWKFKSQVGPFHGKELPRITEISILKRAGLNNHVK